MKLRFWGTREGVASPGRRTMELGGNTPCVQIFVNEKQSIIVDSGTGIIEYASKGVKENENEFHILITHFHWDHIQGFPFFFPIHKKNATIHIYSPFSEKLLYENFALLFDGSYSPLRNLSNLNAQITFHKIGDSGVNIYNAKVYFKPVQHSDICYAYKIVTDEFSIVYALDHENNGNHINNELVEFFKNTDILMHDAHLTQREYEKHTSWGHSSMENAIQNAINGNVKVLFLSSHNPSWSDDYIRLYFRRLMSKLNLNGNLKPIVILAEENKYYNIKL